MLEKFEPFFMAWDGLSSLKLRECIEGKSFNMPLEISRPLLYYGCRNTSALPYHYTTYKPCWVTLEETYI